MRMFWNLYFIFIFFNCHKTNKMLVGTLLCLFFKKLSLVSFLLLLLFGCLYAFVCLFVFSSQNLILRTAKLRYICLSGIITDNAFRSDKSLTAKCKMCYWRGFISAWMLLAGESLFSGASTEKSGQSCVFSACSFLTKHTNIHFLPSRQKDV